MKSLARILIPLLAAFALPAAGGDAVSLTLPIVAAGATSNNITAKMYPGEQENLALSWTSSSTNTTIRVSASVDDVRFHTNYYVLNFGAGTTVTNLNVAGVPVLNIDSILSTGTINATNTASWGRKPNR